MKGSGTVELLIIATLVTDQCRDLRQPLIAISQDIINAFDSVPRDLKPLAFGRLGLPDEFCDVFATRGEGNQTIVLTAYGASDEVLGTANGVFECQRGFETRVRGGLHHVCWDRLD